MENSKSDLEIQLRKVKKEKYVLENEVKGEIQTQETEKYQPLIEQANKVKNEIHKTVTTKYRDNLNELSKKEMELKNSIDDLTIQEASNIWHPQGTIVTLYKTNRYGKELLKQDLAGTVQIYDGTQDTPDNMHYWSLPKKGDVVVFHNKKDGTMGKRFDVISEYGKLKHRFPVWLADGETPTDNLTKTKRDTEKAIDEKDYSF